MSSPPKPLVVVVTGLSGAGRTTVLRALEDLGFFCIDNLPTALTTEAVALCERGGVRRVALGIDVRVRAFMGDVAETFTHLEAAGERDLQVLFLDASDETLVRRYSESRRPHTLAQDGDAGVHGVLEGVALERERLAPLRARASRVIDTTRLSVHDLRRVIISQYGPETTAARMVTRVVSFGFKYGPPVDADLVFDVRFLENPYFVPHLKSLPGTSAPVRDFVLAQPEAHELLGKTLDLLRYVIPKYEREGKSYLTVGIGCTGGRHRSVVLAEELGRALGAGVRVMHRDVLRGLGPVRTDSAVFEAPAADTSTEAAGDASSGAQATPGRAPPSGEKE
ncbi:MAG TPA: RNase adapter RapZ [Polyangiaceae bacterium]|nr:RNase adapter RapZ [Polyangiaceae bacterium]